MSPSAVATRSCRTGWRRRATPQYAPYAVDGQRAVAIGTSDYFTDASQTTREQRFHNAYLLEFDDEGRCRSFTEWFIKQP